MSDETSKTRVRQPLDSDDFEALRLQLAPLPLAAYTCDVSGLIIDFNEQAVTLWGRRPALKDPAERFNGAYKLFAADGTPINHEDGWMAQCLRTQSPIESGEQVIGRPDGTRVSVLVHVNPIFDTQGVCTGAVNVLVDLTKHKETEDKLLESEDRLRDALAAANMGSWRVDLADETITLDENLRRMMGESVQSPMVALNDYYDLILPEDQADVEAAWNLALDTGSLYISEHRVMLGGAIHWLRVQGRYVPRGIGQPGIVTGITLDITDRKRAESELSSAQDVLALQVQTLRRLQELALAPTENKSLRDVLEPILETAAELHKADFGLVSLYDERSGLLKPTAIYGFDPIVVAGIVNGPPAENSGGSLAAFFRRKRVIVEDTFTNPIFKESPENMRHLGARSVHATPIISRSGEIFGVLSVFFRNPRRPLEHETQLAELCARQAADSIEATRARRILQESEIRFRRMANHAPWMVWLTEPDGMCSFVSSSWYEFTGQEPDQGLGYGWGEMLHPDDLDYARQAFFESNVKQIPLDIEFRIKHRDGGYRWTLTAAAPRFSDDGKYLGFVGQLLDITDRKAAEEEGRLETRRLHMLAQTALAIGASRTVESVTRVITEEARLLIGAHQAIISLKLDKDWDEAVHAASFSDKYATWRAREIKPIGVRLYARFGVDNRPLRLTEAQMEKHLSDSDVTLENHPPMRGWLAVPLLARDGRLIGLLKLSDKYESEFTESDEAILIQLALMCTVAIENAQLYDGLRDRDRSKDEFLAMLGHELRNPLSPIRNAIHLLKRDAVKSEEVPRVYAVIERQVDTLVRLVDDLLDVSRVTRGKIQLETGPLLLVDPLQQAIETCEPLIDSQHHELHVEISAEPLLVNGDSVRLCQVFANVLNNAAKYTLPGGEIWISMQCKDQSAVVKIRDNGTGLSRETLPRIFELFSQSERSLDRSQGGLGIGLALAKKLIEMHGGRICAKSPGPGQGSEFTITLPLLTEVTLKGDVIGDTSAGADDRKRIVLVEDNRDSAEVLAMVLRSLGHHVDVAYDGEEGLELLRSRQPHLVLLDIGLPGKTGYEVAAELRKDPTFDETMIVAMTGYGQEQDRLKSKEAGFNHHLTKPVSHRDLEGLLTGINKRA